MLLTAYPEPCYRTFDDPRKLWADLPQVKFILTSRSVYAASACCASGLREAWDFGPHEDEAFCESCERSTGMYFGDRYPDFPWDEAREGLADLFGLDPLAAEVLLPDLISAMRSRAAGLQSY